MSEEMEEILPEEEEENTEVLIEEPTVAEETSQPSLTPQQEVLENLPENVYNEQQFQQEVGEQVEDKFYQASLESRGYDSEEQSAKDKEQDLLNLMFKISEHPNGAHHATNLINNFYKEQGDFRDGGVFEDVDVANLLNPLKEVFPDIYAIPDSIGGEDPRPVSPVADTFKEFLGREWNKRERPVETFAMDAVSATGQTFKEIFYDAPVTWGIGLMETIAGIGDYAAYMFEESKKGIFTGYYDSNITITTKDRTNFRKLTRYHFPKPDEPQTLLGSLALYGGEFGVAYATGKLIYSSIAVPLKSMYPRIAAVLENPGANMAFKEVAGGTVVTTPEARFATALQQMGVTGFVTIGEEKIKWIDYIAGSKDDSVFEERFKSFIDSVYTGVGLATVAPLIMLTGKGAWHASRPAVKGSVEKGKQALAHGASYFDRIFRNFPVEEAMRLDLGGPQPIKTKELLRIQKIAKEQIEKAGIKEQSRNRLAKNLKKVGVKVREKNAVKEMLESQGLKMEDDILQPVIKHEDVESFLIKKKSTKREWSDSINKVMKGMEDGVSYDEIIAGKSDYFPSLYNLKNISGKNRKQSIAELGEIFNKHYANARKSHPETVMDAAKIRGELEHLLGGEENAVKYLQEYAQGSDTLPGYMLALRQYLIEETVPFRMAADNVANLKQKVLSGQLKPKDPVYREALLEFYTNTYKLMDVLEADVKLAGNVARALEARKITVGGTEGLMDAIITSAKDGGLQGEELFVTIAQAVSAHEGPEALLRALNQKKGLLAYGFEALKSIAVGGLLSSPKTLAAVPVGLTTYLAAKTFENYIAASWNTAAKLVYKTTGKPILGAGKGISMSQANAYQFGMAQALLEVFGGTGYFKKMKGMSDETGEALVKRSAFGQGTETAKTLKLGDATGDAHEMIKMAGPSNQKIGEWVMAKGLNADILDELLGLPEVGLKGHGVKFFKFLVNGAGFITSANSRLIMAQDGFFGTILERAEIHMQSTKRAEEILRGKHSAKKGVESADSFSTKELVEESFNVVKNLPPDVAEMAHKGRKIGLMQEQAWKPVQATEDFKNMVSNNPNIPANIGENLVRTYAASKFSFIRTMANIYKQTLTERGIGKIATTLFNGPNRRKFINNEAFRQETMAKIASGSLLMWAGWGLGAKWLNDDEKEVYMEGIDAAKRTGQQMKLVTGKPYGPTITMRDLKTGDITHLPLERLDMAKAPLVLGAIFATKEAQAYEATMKMEGTQRAEGLRQLEEINLNYSRALTDFVLDLPMAKGARETVQNLIPGFGYEWDPGKEVSQFYGFLNPGLSALSSARANIRKIGEGGVRYQKETDAKKMNVPMGEDIPETGRVPGTVYWEDQTYKDQRGQEAPLMSPIKGHSINDLLKFMNQIDEVATRVSIISWNPPDNMVGRIIHRSIGTKQYGDPKYPTIGQDLHAVVGPEGNMVKYFPSKTHDKLVRALKILAIPFSPEVQDRTNTGDLIMGFEIPYEKTEEWNTGTNYSLNPEQKYDWAVLTGELNKQTFSGPYWDEIILRQRLGEFESVSGIAGGRAEKEMVKYQIELMLQKNRLMGMQEMMLRERNGEFMEYWINAEIQRTGNPPLFEKDKL